jgi:VanZ family protein
MTGSAARTTRRSRRHRTGARRPGPLLRAGHYGWLGLALLLLTIHGSLLPYNYNWVPPDEAVDKFRHINWLDLTSLGARGDWVISLLLYSALSFALMGALCVDRRRVLGLLAWPLVSVFCAAVAVALEFTQIYFPPRTVSLNDIALECGGGLLGPLVWLAVGQRVTEWCRRVAVALRSPLPSTGSGVAGLAGRLLPCYAVLLLLVQLMPLDLVYRWDELTVKYYEGKVWAVPFRNHPGDPMQLLLHTLINLACYFPLGFLMALLKGPRSWADRPASVVLAWGAAAAAAVEFLKLFVYSRFSDATNVITGAAAAYLGWRLARACRAYLTRAAGRARLAWPTPNPGGPDWRRTAAWSGAMALWLAALLYLNWRPFDFDFSLRGLGRMAWIPMANYYWGSKFQLFDLFVTKSLAFVPLGVLAAARLRDLYTPGAALRLVLGAFVVTVVIEAGQLYLPLRVPGVTDMLIECAGAWLGFVATRQVRVVLWAETTLGWGQQLNG